VRRWERVHPYNAAQVLEVTTPPDAGRVQPAWDETLRALGLGALRVDGNSYRYEPVRDGLSAVHVPTPPAQLACHLSEQLNRPFAPGDVPFRPFLLASADGTHFLGIVYQHWTADSVSLRVLLREWFLHLYDPAKARTRPVEMPDGGYWKHFGPIPGKWSLIDGVLALPRQFSRYRQVARLRTGGSRDFRMRFSTYSAAGGVIGHVRDYARRRGVTVNDVFLCAMAEACRRHLPLAVTEQRRDLALGTIVDLHSRDPKLDDTFGLFLGFGNVVLKPRAMETFDEMLRSVANQTRHHKATNRSASGMLWFFCSLLFSRNRGGTKTYQYHRKHMPIAAGISNVDVTRTWAADYHPTVIRNYIRSSPTGPMIPLAFTPTTLGQTFNLGLTYRSAVISDEIATGIAATFLARLNDLP
jgi:hypothetical protein